MTPFEQAREFLQDLSLSDFLHQLLGPEARTLLDQSYGCVHLGFLALPGDLAQAAASAGFAAFQASYPSEVMARELAVPITIFKAWSSPGKGRIDGVEVFVPQAPEAVVRRWMKDEVGRHVGVGLREPEAVFQALELCRAAGLRLPGFLGGQPARNAREDILVLYADGGPLRVEFYHAPAEVARWAARAEAEG